MTVKELVVKLKEMPQEATVDLEIITPYGAYGSAKAEPDEIFEGVNNKVVIQGLEA